MKSLIISFLALVSVSSFANCDISENEGVSKKYAYLLNVQVPGKDVKHLKSNDIKKLDSEVLNCIDEIDLSFELGDGYYSTVFTHYYAVYYPQSTRVAGYVQISGMTYTEADDASEITMYLVRFNSRGQRVSPVGEY